MGIKFVEAMLGMAADAVAEAAGIVEPHDDTGELDAFAEKLSGLGGLTWPEMEERTAGTAVPGDYRHLRLTNLNKGEPWGGIFNLDQSPLKFKDVLVTTSIHADRDDVTATGKGVWTHTIALPVRDPGVLELGLRFEPLH